MTPKSAFPAVVTPQTRLLILGSLPGDASLAAGRYYAHPQNQFWKLVGTAIGEDLPARDYDARLATLQSRNIGLWDTIATATRQGSLDAAIRNARPAPLADLAASLPQLEAIAFNGTTSARIGRRQLPPDPPWALIDLPSSSPAHAALSLAAKQDRWNLLRKFIA